MGDREWKDLSWDEAITVSSPHPYVLATTVDAAGKTNAIGLGWWTVCSWEPPMLVISVGTKRYSRELLDACGEFVLCLIGEEHARGAWVCGTKSGRKTDKLAAAGLTAVPSSKVKVPTIGESVCAFECRVRQRVEAGDHILYVGEIVAMRGVAGNPRHLFSLHYRRLIAIGPDGAANTDVRYKD